jgi:hypothetical protein
MFDPDFGSLRRVPPPFCGSVTSICALITLYVCGYNFLLLGDIHGCENGSYDVVMRAVKPDAGHLMIFMGQAGEGRH